MRLAWLVWLAAGGVVVISAGCATGGTPDGGRSDTGRLDATGDTGAVDGGTNPDDVPGLDGGERDGGGTDAPPCMDEDGDGFGVGPGCTGLVDCADDDDTVFPEATEACNGVNDDCDGGTDEGFGMESCGVGACLRMVSTCVDGTPRVCEPGAASTETCNAIDDDCNGTVDDGFGAPTTCGTGACARSVPMCSGGTPMTCTPGTPTAETCNAVDDDCNGTADDGLGSTTCGTGACRRTASNCVGGVPQVCAPGAPGTEVCNGQDDDCDGNTDEALGTLSCGFGRCVATAPVCVGGAPGTCVPNSGASRPEMCDGIDDDCDGAADDAIPDLTCGVGACMRSVTACITGVPQTCTPGAPATEICGDAVDQDCNGTAEGVPGNSTCSSPIAYTIGSTITGDNSCANHEYVTSGTCFSRGLGYDSTYSFASTGGPTRYTIRMTGPTGYDTVLHAHAASACAVADELACNDDFAGTNVSEVNVDSPPSGTVWLVADSYTASSGGTFTLTSSTTALNNDTCASVIPLRANGRYTGTTTGRVSDFTGVSCQANTTGEDVIYSITARSSGTITLDTCGSSFDTVLYVGTTCGAFATACDDDAGSGACGELTSTTSFAATAGTTYYIVVDGYNSQDGTYVLNVSGY
jgi:hypothetical protein